MHISCSSSAVSWSPPPPLLRPLSWSIGLSRKYSVLFVDISALPCPPNHVYSSDRSADDNPARMKCTCHMPPHATTGLSRCDDVFMQPLSTLLRFNFSLQHRSNCRRGSGRECGRGKGVGAGCSSERTNVKSLIDYSQHWLLLLIFCLPAEGKMERDWSLFDWITHAEGKKEREGEIGVPFYGCVVRRTATAKHKNPFGFLQRAALMSGTGTEAEAVREVEERRGRGATFVVLKLIAKQKGMRATTAYPDHVRINNKRSKHRQSGRNK